MSIGKHIKEHNMLGWDGFGVPEWKGATLETVGGTSGNGHVLFPPTICAREPTLTLTTFPSYWFAMPFIIPNNMMGKLDRFRLEYTNQLTSTHTRAAVWDGVTGQLIESAQEAHSSGTVCHVDLTGTGWGKYIFVGFASGIPGTPANQGVTVQAGVGAQCTNLGLDISASLGKAVSAVFIVLGTGDWEVPPTTLNYDDDVISGGLSSPGNIAMASSVATPMFCCLSKSP